MGTIRVLVVDDDVRFRRLVSKFLATEGRIAVVGEAGNGLEAVEKSRFLKPELVLMDVKMPKLNGLEAARRIRSHNPQTQVLILSMYDLDEYRHAATNCGVSAYVIKRNVARELVPTIREMFFHKEKQE